MLEELVKAAADHDLEKQLLPLWLAHFAIKTLQGGKPMSFEEMLCTVRGGEQGAAAPSSKMTAEEIMKEFAPIIAADKLRREKRGKDTSKEPI